MTFPLRALALSTSLTLLAALPAAGGQVFVSVAPCRIADTRVAGGAIAGGTQRKFDVVGLTTDFSAQGGAATGCGVPGFSASVAQVQAIALNVVAVNSTGSGYLTAFAGDGSRPTASTLNFANLAAGFAIANGVIVPVRQTAPQGADIKVFASTTTDVFLDVAGYFTDLTLLDGSGSGIDADTVDGLDSSQFGDITGVTAGTGLTGGATTGNATLNVNLAGSGAATTIARSDHNHLGQTWTGATTNGLLVQNSTASGAVTAVKGVASGVSNGGAGVWGETASPGGAGIYGLSTGSNGTGVLGEANTGTNAYGVWGSSTSGFAGYFDGQARVTGKLDVGSFSLQTGAAAGKILVSDASGNATWQPPSPRKYYLSKTFPTGNQILTACADGYHTATLWEIFNTSVLSYDTTLGVLGDAASPPHAAPPNGASGWIRTGNAPNTGTTPGTANCNLYASVNSAHNGTVVSISQGDWLNGVVTPISPWFASTQTCDAAFRVWCVQD